MTIEADVERNFSLQREIQGKHSANISIDTIEARITLNSKEKK